VGPAEFDIERPQAPEEPEPPPPDPPAEPPRPVPLGTSLDDVDTTGDEGAIAQTHRLRREVLGRPVTWNEDGPSPQPGATASSTEPAHRAAIVDGFEHAEASARRQRGPANAGDADADALEVPLPVIRGPFQCQGKSAAKAKSEPSRPLV
jgi:hypothetical protein